MRKSVDIGCTLCYNIIVGREEKRKEVGADGKEKAETTARKRRALTKKA